VWLCPCDAGMQLQEGVPPGRQRRARQRRTISSWVQQGGSPPGFVGEEEEDAELQIDLRRRGQGAGSTGLESGHGWIGAERRRRGFQVLAACTGAPSLFPYLFPSLLPSLVLNLNQATGSVGGWASGFPPHFPARASLSRTHPRSFPLRALAKSRRAAPALLRIDALPA